MSEFKNIENLKDGGFLENAGKVKYVVKRNDNKQMFTLIELNPDGTVMKDAKSKNMPFDLLDGLIRTRHFFISKFPQRISHGELDKKYEFDKRVPK